MRSSLLLLFAVATAHAEQRPITHEDLWLMPRVGPAVVSPDGRRAVVSVIKPAYDDAEQRNDLWLIDVSGKAAPRRLTFDAAPESGATWAPDNQRIAYSKKGVGDSAAQIYVIDLRGGEAQRVTTLPTDARTPQFSPDGTKLLFVSSVYPGALNAADNQKAIDDRAARKYNVRVFDGFPIRNWDKWLDERQTHPFVLTLGSSDEPKDLLAATALAKEKGLGGRQTETGEELDAIFAPDSASVIFVASINRHRAALAFTNTDLYQVDLNGGEPRRLTGDGNVDAPTKSYGRPRFAPDGKTLFAQVTPIGGRAYFATRLSAIDWPNARVRASIELPNQLAVSSFAIDKDSKTLWISAEDQGEERIYRARDGQAPSLWIDPAGGVYTNLSAGNGTLIAGYERADLPAEVVRLDLSRKSHAPLTAFTAAKRAPLDLAPAESFTFTNADGMAVQSYLIKPPGFDPNKKYPLFVLIHGGPHIMWRDQFFLRWNYHLIGAPGYVVLLTNYRGSTGFGETFAQAIHQDPFRGPANDVNAAADEAIKRYAFIDGERQCAGGASYGGHLANWLQGTTTRYRCLVSHAGLVNAEAQWGTSDTIYGREIAAGGPPWEQGPVWREQNPIRLAASFKTPVLVTIGEQDFRVPLNNTLEYWSALQRMQVESRLIVFPDENHWILKGENSRYFYAELRDWLARYL